MITNKTLSSASPQQVFDQVANHIMQQGGTSSNANGDCVYRGANGLKCAAGCLIADDEYNPEMEGIIWCEIPSKFGLDISSHVELITALQDVHDISAEEYSDKFTANEWYCWVSRMIMVATDYELSTTVFDPDVNPIASVLVPN